MDSNANPYEAPRAEIDARWETTPMREFRWWRFTVVFCVAIGLNLLRLAMTWKAYGTDGYEQVGWPWAFYERGGFSGGEHFYPSLFLADVAVALGLAYVSGRVTAVEVGKQIRRFQTCGTPEASRIGSDN
jgi:hypothetical protein